MPVWQNHISYGIKINDFAKKQQNKIDDFAEKQQNEIDDFAEATFNHVC